MVWVIDPEARLGRVYRLAANVSLVEAGGMMSAEPAVPGFEVSLKEMFEAMDREFEG